jgi:integrase
VGYNAIVSQKVMDYIRRTTLGGDYVIYYDKDNSTSFDQLYRKKLLSAIQSKGLYSVREDTSIFHSFRKTFSEKLLTNHELEPEGFTYQLLMGHIPRTTTATKYYVHTDGTKEKIDVIKRCADAYSKSELVNMTIGLI